MDVITCSHEELLLSVVEVSSVVQCWDQQLKSLMPRPVDATLLVRLRNSCPLLPSVINVASVVQCWDQQRQHFPSIPQVSRASVCGCYITGSVEELLPLVVEVSWLVDVITCQHEELLLSVVEVSSVVQCWDQQKQQHFPSIPQVSRALAGGCHMRNSCHNH